MTIFRCSFLLCGLLAGCGSIEPKLPDPKKPLGEIARIENFADRGRALKAFTEKRIADRAALGSELSEAGFTRSTVRGDKGEQCDRYDWSDKTEWPVWMIIVICGHQVTANAGQTAP